MSRTKKQPAAGQMGMAFPDYPVGRPRSYAEHFQVYALRMGVNMDHGPEAFAMLAAIVLTEHKVRYMKSVRFWNDQMSAYCGCSEDRMTTVRKSLVNSGWLHYTPGRKSISGIYWVLVPGGDEQLVCSSLGDGNSCFVSADSGSNTDSNTDSNRFQTGFKPDHSNLNLIASPSSFVGWEAAIEDLKNSGIKKFEEAVRAASTNGLRPSDVQALVTWWHQRREGFRRPHGALYYALTETRPQSMGAIAECFPPVDPAVAARLEASDRQARELERRRDQASAETRQASVLRSAKQLELDFETQYGRQLDELPEPQLRVLCDTLPSSVWQIVHKHGRNAPAVRFSLLEAFGRMFEQVNSTKG